MKLEEWLAQADTVFAAKGETIYDYAEEDEIIQVYIDGDDPVEWATEVTD